MRDVSWPNGAYTANGPATGGGLDGLHTLGFSLCLILGGVEGGIPGHQMGRALQPCR
jgi:hypothetical protein